ncbi:hypothetical protein QFZ55_005362 [Streptomyces luteogriseus]|nr:hypothetical protein [Streptomyces luteogriseus]
MTPLHPLLTAEDRDGVRRHFAARRERREASSKVNGCGSEGTSL